MTRPRRFTLSDASILIGSMAVSFGVLRPIWYRSPTSPGTLTLRVVQWFLGFVVPGVLAWLAMRLSQPRPRFRKLVRQPGFVANVAALFGLTVVTGVWGLGQVSRSASGFFPGDLIGNVFCILWLSAAGVAVASSWLTLAMVGCRAEPSWLDRAGRVLGLAWILASSAFWIKLVFEF